ncbi:MAG: type II toxin-antitoxin system Phd/YefM family antitoxin [Coriobacteriia bacterium]
MTRVTAAQARRDFSEILNRASYGKERVIVTRHDADVAAVVPIEELRMFDAAMAVLKAHPQLAQAIESIEVAREAQAAWGQVQSEVDTLVLSPESYDAVLDLIEHPQSATAALRELMRDES